MDMGEFLTLLGTISGIVVVLIGYNNKREETRSEELTHRIDLLEKKVVHLQEKLDERSELLRLREVEIEKLKLIIENSKTRGATNEKRNL
ncbi:MAG: hypothetical protein LBS33_03280 [Streptococcaceae bacterium]|jgi:hypothetical protein|nr:hypothetical protein [Streptococcaceae bacterium]